MMISKRRALAVLPMLGLGSVLASGAAQAGAQDPLFINLTSDDPHRVSMALTFGTGQLRLGHPLTVFLNDRAVMVGLKANSVRFGDQQAMIAALLQAGATVLVCPMCLRHYGGTEAGLLPGLRMGNPELTGQALFGDGTRSLTW